jgi:hypothetical protein
MYQRNVKKSRTTDNERLVVLPNLIQAPVGGVICHQNREGPLVLGAIVLLIKVRRDERLEHKPTAKVHSASNILVTLPTHMLDYAAHP